MRLPDSRIRRGRFDVTTTPMIDVVFLLLIFFVCTASFQIAEDILPTSILDASSSLPAGGEQLETELEQLLIKVLWQDGMDNPTNVRWVIHERTYNSLAQVRELLAAVAEIDTSLPVVLDIDGRVPLYHVIDLYDACRLAGFDRIQFVASIDT